MTKFLRKISDESEYEAIRQELIQKYHHKKALVVLYKNLPEKKIFWKAKMPASFDKSFEINSFSTIL